jgi:hypothetical protein
MPCKIAEHACSVSVLHTYSWKHYQRVHLITSGLTCQAQISVLPTVAVSCVYSCQWLRRHAHEARGQLCCITQRDGCCGGRVQLACLQPLRLGQCNTSTSITYPYIPCTAMMEPRPLETWRGGSAAVYVLCYHNHCAAVADNAYSECTLYCTVAFVITLLLSP